MFNSSTFIEHCKVAADYLVTVLRNDGRRVPKSFRFDKKAKFIRKRLQLHHRRREMTKLHCRSDIMLHVACQKLKRKSNLNCKILPRFVTADDLHVTLYLRSPPGGNLIHLTLNPQDALSVPKRTTGTVQSIQEVQNERSQKSYGSPVFVIFSMKTH